MEKKGEEEEKPVGVILFCTKRNMQCVQRCEKEHATEDERQGRK